MKCVIPTLAFAALACAADPNGAKPQQSMAARVADGTIPLRDACKGTNAPPIYLLETRAAERFTQNLLIVDGLNVDRDITIILCKGVIKQQANTTTKPITIAIRAQHKPRDGEWRDIDAYQASREEEVMKRVESASKPPDSVLPALYEVTINDPEKEPLFDPIVIVPLRRLPTRPEDIVRIVITINNKERALDSTFRVDRFGLHALFFDSVMFIQRWGEDAANASGTWNVSFDSVNFRPAPGINYGFTYYNRRSQLLRFVEPGFGANLSFLSWNDQLKSVASATQAGVTPPVSPLQVGVGVMGSIFDNVVVATIGWNLNVKDQRTYFGVGLSVTGMVRKLSRFVR